MDGAAVTFVVEDAGCDACAARVRDALAPLVAVEAVDVDETANVATVHGRATPACSYESVDAALRRASAGAGHAYAVRPGSWSEAA